MGLLLIVLLVIQGFKSLGVDFSTSDLYFKIISISATLFFVGGFLIDALFKGEDDRK